MKHEMSAVVEMPKYKCHKDVYALEIAQIQVGAEHVEMAFANDVFVPISLNLEWYNKHKPVAGGYYVVYEDGYASYSPKKAFEEGYTLIK